MKWSTDILSYNITTLISQIPGMNSDLSVRFFWTQYQYYYIKLRKCLRQEREEEAQEKECNGLGATWRWKTGSTIHDSTIYCTYI